MENSLCMICHYNMKVFVHYITAKFSLSELFTYAVAIVGSSHGSHCWYYP